MPLKDGEIITLDYEGRTDGILFDTTLEKVAKKEDAVVENRKYSPITVVEKEFEIGCQDDENINTNMPTMRPLSLIENKYIVAMGSEGL